MENQNKAIALTTNAPVIAIDDKKIDEYLEAFGLANNLKKNEIKIFREIAVAYQLNPFKREIYCVAYEGKKGRSLSVITGYEVYLKRADRLGLLDGWSCEPKGSKKDGSLKAVLTIHRKDWKQPFVHEVYWLEYKQDNNFWNNKPITMLKKVAIAQGFRLCFPDEFGGMPYTPEELPDEMNGMKDVTGSVIPEGEASGGEAKKEEPKKTNKAEKKTDKDTESAVAETFNGTIIGKEFDIF